MTAEGGDNRYTFSLVNIFQSNNGLQIVLLNIFMVTIIYFSEFFDEQF